jgi:hypothetical protein
MSTDFSAEKEFIKDRQRYINIALNSDKRIQILMLLFIIDANEDILVGQTGDIISLYKQFPEEIMLDLKVVNKSNDENVIKEFISRYGLKEEDYTLEINNSTNFSLTIQPKLISKFIQDNTIGAVREKKMNELGL